VDRQSCLIGARCSKGAAVPGPGHCTRSPSAPEDGRDHTDLSQVLFVCWLGVAGNRNASRALSGRPHEFARTNAASNQFAQSSLSVRARQVRTAQARRRRLVMSKALVLGAAALVFSAASASAQVYTTPDYSYADPVADLAAPADGYAAPAAPPVYTAPPVYAAPVYTPPPVYVVPAPVYVAPLVPRYYAAPVVSQPIYAYAPRYWGGYGHGWGGYGHRYVGWR
jgi:hypothetical protein